MKTFWKTDFTEAVVPFRASFQKNAGTVAFDTNAQFQLEGPSLMLQTPAQQYANAAVNRWFPFPASGAPAPRLGADVWFQFPEANAQVAFEVALEAFDGVRGHFASIQWITADAFSLSGWRLWQGASGSGKWEFITDPLASVIPSAGWYQWHRLQVEVDYATHEYFRVVVDGANIEVPGQAQRLQRKVRDAGVGYELRDNQTQGPYWAPAIHVWSQTASVARVFLGSVELYEL